MTQRFRIALVGEDEPGPARDGSCAVSFISPAFGAARTLPDCIASIRASAPPRSEVIVVDDGSLDETLALAGELADVVVQRPCQGGAARSRNDGARVARGDVLLFVDADVTVTPEAVAGILRLIEDGADAAFGAYAPFPPAAVRNAATTYKNLLHHYTHQQSAGPANTFWSGFGAIRREAFEAVRGFDAAVTTGADVEDIHLGYRLSSAGFRIVLDPNLQVYHHKHYTLRGVVISDVVHRAIPWTRAMLQLRTFSPDLNVRRHAIIASATAYGVLVAVAAAPFSSPLMLLAAGVFGGLWLILNRGFLGYVLHHWDRRGALISGGLLYLYYLYCPPGAILGVVAHVLRGSRRSRLNWLRLDPVDRDLPEMTVTLAVIASAEEPLATLEGLPPPASWWELIVVSPTVRCDLPAGAKFIKARSPNATRNQMRQQALEVAQGEMFATLDAQCVPGPGWLDQVREAARRSDVVVAGPFDQDRRGIRQRASQVARYWDWRPERPATWLSDHPPANAAFRTEVAQALGGFKVEGALLFRIAGLGARPVRFDPAMGVRLTATEGLREFIRGVVGTSRLRSAASARYYELGPLSRVVLAAAMPVWGFVALLRVIRSAVAEGTADRTFVMGFPLATLALAGHWVGRGLGLINPAYRGGMVPYTAEDLAVLPYELPTASVR